MRKVFYLSAAFFSAITILSILFKILHLAGAPQLLTLGLGGIAFIVIPSFAKYKYDKSKLK